MEENTHIVDIINLDDKLYDKVLVMREEAGRGNLEDMPDVLDEAIFLRVQTNAMLYRDK